MKIGMKTGVMVGLILLLAALPLGSGCAPKKEVKKPPIRIGSESDLTGPTAAQGVTVAFARMDYFRWLNEEKGGINGYPVELITVDTMYDIAKETTTYKKMVTVDKIHLFMSYSTGGGLALAPRFEEDKMVNTPGGTHPLLVFPPGWTFPPMPLYNDGWRAVIKWIKGNWTLGRPPRVALGYADDAFGKAPLPSIRYWANKWGWEIVNETVVGGTIMDATTEVKSLKRGDPDYVFLHTHPTGLVTTVIDAYKLGFRTQFITNPWLIDPVTLERGGAAVEGAIGFTPYALWTETNLPGIKLATELFKKWHPEQRRMAIMYGLGWLNGLVAAEGLRIALDKVGYENLTGDAIRKAIESIKDLDTGGFTAPLTYTPDDHRGPKAVKLVRIRGGGFEVFTDWLEAPPLDPVEKTPEFYK